MIAKEIMRDQLWQTVHKFVTMRPNYTIRLYFKCTEGTYEGLPVAFLQDDYRLPRLLIDQKALKKSSLLPEPFRKDMKKAADKNNLFSLSMACNRYFGPYCRPERPNQTYNAYYELHFNMDEIRVIFPDIDSRFYYGQYIRFDQLAALYFGDSPDETIRVEEETPIYQPAQIFPLNLILYGPPGTGKTYHAVTYAVAIIEGKTVEEIKEESRETVGKRFYGYMESEQVAFITFHQSYSYEDFVQGLRPDANHTTENLRFKLSDGIFKKIADRAKANYDAYQQNKLQPQLPFETLLDRLLIESMNRVTEEVELPILDYQGQFKSIIIYEVGDTYLKYKRRSLRDVVKDEERLLYISKLKEKYYDKDIREAINKQYYETVVNAVKKFEQQTKQASAGGKLKNYVLIIDEINRANISRVFGELITLLEEDKRYGRENQLSATLPSGESFSVSTNLYVIGTMNTADKSIALLDVALRRRFEFIGMFPDYNLIPQFSEILQPLNEKIREKKGADFMIGHSFFINKEIADLEAIFNRKIIPLLYEYFNNRAEVVKEVLKATGLEIVEENYQLQVKAGKG